MDALNDEYEKIRGVAGSFSGVEEAAYLISEAKKKNHIDASVNFTLTKNTIDGFKDVKRFADKTGLPLAVCLLDKTSAIFNAEENAKGLWIYEEADFKRLDELLGLLNKEKRERPDSLLINFTGIDYIRDYFRDPQQREIPCIASQDRIIIDPYGNLLGGCMAMGSFGNMRRTAFGILRREERYRTAKRNMFYKRCRGCSCGYLFNIRLFPPLILREFIEKMAYR
jgi:MoaA/NifB/PqqE/SkfB family radical SAM enzyme